jgi:hypothetical protein
MNTDSWIHNTKQEEAGGTRVEETKLSAHSHTHTQTHRGRERERGYWCGLESVSMVSTADFLKFGWTRAARATKPPIECPTSITLDGNSFED